MRLLSVVVNYKTPDLLNRFLNTYKTYVDNPDRQLIIVDVESDYSPIESLEDLGLENMPIVYRTPFNIGYAKAVNMGVHIARSSSAFDVVAAFNSDTFFLDRDCVDSCLALFEKDDEIGVVGPMQVDENQRITHAGITGNNESHQMRGWYKKNLDAYRDVIDCVTVSGSAYFVRDKTWLELSSCEKYTPFSLNSFGAFLPTQHYYEETFCSLHAREHGWRVVYNGEAMMGHSWHKSSPLNSDTDNSIMKASRDLYREACKAHGIKHN